MGRPFLPPPPPVEESQHFYVKNNLISSIRKVKNSKPTEQITYFRMSMLLFDFYANPIWIVDVRI